MSETQNYDILKLWKCIINKIKDYENNYCKRPVWSWFGSSHFAEVMGVKAVILPQKDNKEEFEAESSRIFNILSFFTRNLNTVSFEEREAERQTDYDIIADLKAGTLSDEVWQRFASLQLTPSFTEGLPEYKGMAAGSVLFIPQKLISDGECGLRRLSSLLVQRCLAF